MEDMQMLCSEDAPVDYKMRFALIYRSERKKILHSQLHLVTWLQNIINDCDQCEVKREELDSYFKELSFKKTVFEETILKD